MRELAKSKMVKGLDFEMREDFSFCEPCVQGKSYRLPIPIIQCEKDRSFIQDVTQ